VLKGASGGAQHPLFRLRYVPDLPPPPGLAALALAAVRGLGLDQLAEVELVGGAGGAWHVIEVNPRASGVTALLRAANGTGSPAVCLRLAAGEGAGLPSRCRCACEFPVSPPGWAELVRAAQRLPSLVHLHATVTNAFWPRCYLAAGTPDELRRDLERLAPVCGSRLVAELDERVQRARELSEVAPGLSP
jgi:hypothetical protein